MAFKAGVFDIAVVGAGHAGCEAALACARLGFKTVIFAINLDSIANLPCNPSIGGTAKGHLVREVDALGGEMGKVADKTLIQSKILNSAKGPAVYSLRAQIDRRRYQIEMKHILEKQENLEIRQAEVVDVLTEDQKITGVLTNTGAIYQCKCAVLATGTYLRAKIIIGDYSCNGGPDGIFAANNLTEKLSNLKLTIMRFKTGTPARVNRRSVDFTKMIPQTGDVRITPFSFETDEINIEQELCYLTNTTLQTKQIILNNIDRSPLYNGSIEGIGPRYCPSIETKITKFADKDTHQVFIEPMGRETEELYLQGMSSSLPEDVQIELIRSVPGLENVSITRPAYAIEYDAIDATELKLSLESRIIDGLFCAGQINGSSGYEEAAAQGLMAGINAALKLRNEEPLIIDRSEGYIGVLIDDLVTRGTKEPYRMMTSRAEYRLLLRQDNADMRLTNKGYKIGLISQKRYDKLIIKKELVENEIKRIEKFYLTPDEKLNNFLLTNLSTPLKGGASIADLLRRPEISYELLKEFDINRPDLSFEVKEQVEINVKYEGYIKRQLQQVEQFKKLEQMKLPMDIDYNIISNLRIEAREKLNQIKPESIGQASRITGVSPADISSLLIYFSKLERGEVK